MYKFAYKFNDDIIFYFDACGNKYVASGGNFAWRINNPGLVRSHSHFSRAKIQILTANGNMNSKATVIKKRSNQRSMNIKMF